MPISDVIQPEILQVDQEIRLRKYDGNFSFAYPWYQDEETVYLVDGKRNKYSMEKLKQMYTYLDACGELYFIEYLVDDTYIPIGDVTFWQEDMPIVIGDKAFRGKGVGRRVVSALVQRARELGYDTIYVDEIYDFNTASRKCFESVGFREFEIRRDSGRFRLEL